MKKNLITFGDNKFKGALQDLKETALTIGNVDDVKIYSKSWLKNTNFYNKNRFILDQPRGAGYWIWKPFIILERFKELEYGDILMYSDAAVKIINDLNILFDIADKKDRVVFKIGGNHLNKIWTKKDCFVLMNCDEPKYYNSIQLTASYSLWKKTDENINYLKEYLKYLKDPRISTDSPNMLGANDLLFKDHRHDQSVLSLMSIKYNWERFRDISQFGNKEINKFNNSTYSQLVFHHRQRY
jgi:hypothetical protein